MAYPQEIIERIRSEVSIAEIIGESVTLKRSGKNLSGLCPFHAEKTPSFFVNDEDGFFNCFGCGKKGSVFDFVMETRGLSFPEAVRFLARRVGIELPEQVNSRGELEKRRRTLVLRELMRVVLRFYRDQLAGPEGKEARSYLSRRVIPAEVTETFQLGYAPDGDLLMERIPAILGERGKELFPDSNALKQALQDCGLLTSKSAEFSYDTFRSRLIFPITRSDGSPIALGGRLLRPHETRPKYINSRETLLYQKARSFFGMAQAMKHLRLVREVYLVEGYMDVLAMHQLGFVNTVATCGTAVTPEHVKVLKRLVDRVIVVFDGDSAGIKAAAKCFEVFLNSGIEVQGTSLPEGEDPGSLAEKNLGDQLRNSLSDRRPAIDLYIENRKRESGFSGGGAPTLSGKIAEQAMKLIRKVENSVEREFFLRRVAERLGVSIESLDKLGQREQFRSSGVASRGEDRAEFVNSSVPVSEIDDQSWRDRTGGEFDLRSQVTFPSVCAGDFISSYQRQLLVAIASEPMLARSVLEMPSLRVTDSGAADSVVISDSIRGFLDAVSTLNLPGIASLISSDVAHESPEFVQTRKALSQLLERFGFSSDEIIAEAVRQSTVGGGQPRKVAEAAPFAVAKSSLAQQVERLRTAEASADDAQRLAEIAQEKLMKRRHLERLKGTKS